MIHTAFRGGALYLNQAKWRGAYFKPTINGLDAFYYPLYMPELEPILNHFDILDHEDIGFLFGVASSIECRLSIWQGRTVRNLKLALEMNQSAGNLVEPSQLTVAVLAHDIAMGFLPLELLRKPESLNSKERSLMRGHIKTAGDLIKRMGHWEAAHKMILSHHEWVNGAGYPQGRLEQEIGHGAKILAIVDAFTAQGSGNVMHGVMEVHRFSGTQFSEFWIKHFDRAVKTL